MIIFGTLMSIILTIIGVVLGLLCVGALFLDCIHSWEDMETWLYLVGATIIIFWIVGLIG